MLLLLTYLSVTIAVVAFAGLERLAEFDDDDAVFSSLAGDALGSPWDKLVVLGDRDLGDRLDADDDHPLVPYVVLDGASGCAAEVFARIHPRFRTPYISTAVVAALAIAWYVPANALSENFLFDTLSALSLLIAFYYALTGIACAVYYRRELFSSVRTFVFVGLAPLAGAAILAYLLVKSALDLANPDNSYSGQSILGMGVPLAIALAFIILGIVILMLGGLPAMSGSSAGARSSTRRWRSNERDRGRL